MQKEIDAERVQLGQEADEVLQTAPRRSTLQSITTSNCRRLGTSRRMMKSLMMTSNVVWPIMMA
jgi:hypothetical protein